MKSKIPTLRVHLLLDAWVVLAIITPPHFPHLWFFTENEAIFAPSDLLISEDYSLMSGSRFVSVTLDASRTLNPHPSLPPVWPPVLPLHGLIFISRQIFETVAFAQRNVMKQYFAFIVNEGGLIMTSMRLARESLRCETTFDCARLSLMRRANESLLSVCFACRWRRSAQVRVRMSNSQLLGLATHETARVCARVSLFTSIEWKPSRAKQIEFKFADSRSTTQLCFCRSLFSCEGGRLVERRRNLIVRGNGEPDTTC